MEQTTIRKFKVKTMDGNSADLEMDENKTGKDLKAEILTHLNIPVERQRIIFKSALVKDEDKLSKFIKQDGEWFHVMAMTQEQVRDRAQTQSQNQNQSNNSAGGNPFGANQNPFGMLGNLLQGLGGNPAGGPPPVGQTHMSFGNIDLNQLLGGLRPPAQSPASNPQSTRSNPPAPTPQPASRNPSNANSQSTSNTPNPSVNTGRTGTTSTRVQVNTSRRSNPPNVPRARRRTGSTTEIALPHNHVYEVNRTCNRMMGEEATFPGPPLPPSGHQRSPSVILGSFLETLQFAMQRLSPFIWRSGELLQRESVMANSMDRAEAQHLVNETGNAMEQLGRSLILSSHYYSNLTIQESPGHYAIRSNPHQDFSQMVNTFVNNQFGRADTNNPAPSTSSQNQAPTSSQSQAPTSSASQAPQPNTNTNQPRQEAMQNLLNMTTNLLGMVSNQLGNLGNRAQNPPNAPAQQPESRPSGSSPQQPASSQSRGVSFINFNNYLQTNSNEESKEERVQSAMNNAVLGAITNLANSPDNPLGSLGRTFQDAISNSGGGNFLSQTFENLASDGDSPTTFIGRVVGGTSPQDLIAIFWGNYQAVTQLHPRMRDLLISDYMNGEDNENNRQVAADKISEEIYSEIVIPESVRNDVKPGSDPVKITSEIIKKHTRKALDGILDTEVNTNNSSEFINRMMRVKKWWIGDLIDSLKPHFNGDLQSVLKFIRGNLEKNLTNSGSDFPRMMQGVFVDTIMNSISSSYSEYLSDKKREDEAEARELGITLQQLYQNRRHHDEEESKKDAEEESKMEVDEDPVVKEEPVNSLQSTSSNPVTSHATPLNSVPKREKKEEAKRQEEEKEKEEEKDPEMKKLIEQMEEDQSQLLVNPPSTNPRSNIYKALDTFNDRNIDTPNPITSRGNFKQDAKVDSKNILVSALKECGFPEQQINNNLGEVEMDDDFVDHFKGVVKEEARARKDDEEYVPGQHPNLEKL